MSGGAGGKGKERAMADDFTYCAYCGAQFPLDGDGSAVAEHIQWGCVKHPMYELRRLAVGVVRVWRQAGGHAEHAAHLDGQLADLERHLRQP